jgi:hypothetical protein
VQTEEGAVPFRQGGCARSFFVRVEQQTADKAIKRRKQCAVNCEAKHISDDEINYDSLSAARANNTTHTPGEDAHRALLCSSATVFLGLLAGELDGVLLA